MNKNIINLGMVGTSPNSQIYNVENDGCKNKKSVAGAFGMANYTGDVDLREMIRTRPVSRVGVYITPITKEGEQYITSGDIKKGRNLFMAVGPLNQITYSQSNWMLDNNIYVTDRGTRREPVHAQIESRKKRRINAQSHRYRNEVFMELPSCYLLKSHVLYRVLVRSDEFTINICMDSKYLARDPCVSHHFRASLFIEFFGGAASSPSSVRHKNLILKAYRRRCVFFPSVSSLQKISTMIKRSDKQVFPHPNGVNKSVLNLISRTDDKHYISQDNVASTFCPSKKVASCIYTHGMRQNITMFTYTCPILGFLLFPVHNNTSRRIKSHGVYRYEDLPKKPSSSAVSIQERKAVTKALHIISLSNGTAYFASYCDELRCEADFHRVMKKGFLDSDELDGIRDHVSKKTNDVNFKNSSPYNFDQYKTIYNKANRFRIPVAADLVGQYLEMEMESGADIQFDVIPLLWYPKGYNHTHDSKLHNRVKNRFDNNLMVDLSSYSKRNQVLHEPVR